VVKQKNQCHEESYQCHQYPILQTLPSQSLPEFFLSLHQLTQATLLKIGEPLELISLSCSHQTELLLVVFNGQLTVRDHLLEQLGDLILLYLLIRLCNMMLIRVRLRRLIKFFA